jgi:hypothetical protein
LIWHGVSYERRTQPEAGRARVEGVRVQHEVVAEKRRGLARWYRRGPERIMRELKETRQGQRRLQWGNPGWVGPLGSQSLGWCRGEWAEATPYENRPK